MKRMKRLRKIFVYLLAFLIAVLAIPSTAFAEEEITQASAVTMKMKKTEGTVKAVDKNGKAVSVFKDMRLYDGYKVETLKNGYAWIDLDSTKLIKLDAYSSTVVQKSGKELDIILKKGKLFFNIAEPLAEDETMNIRTSTMAVGIRGTCGWIETVNKNETKISILEGSVQAAVINSVTGEVRVESVSGGETVTCVSYSPADPGGKFDILRDRFSEKDVPGFVVVDTASDKALVEKIFEKSKTDVDLRRLTQSEARKRLYTEQSIANNEPLENNAGGDSDSSASSGTPAPSAPDAPTTPAPSAPDAPTTPAPSEPSNVTHNFNEATKTLTISGSGRMEEYSSSERPLWYAYRGDIQTVVIGDGVTSIGSWAFDGCSSLRNVEIPSSVQSIGYSAFGDCDLREVVIPSNVTNIGGYAFCGCNNLTSVQISSSVQSIGDGAFLSCKLTEVEIPSSVTSIGERAFSCLWQSLTKINVQEGNVAYYSDNGILFTKDTLVAYPGGKTNNHYDIPTGVKSIYAGAFERCYSLTSVGIPTSVTSIGDVAFFGCSLTSVEIPAGVTSIGNSAFRSCLSLTEVKIPSSVTSIGNEAFLECSSSLAITYLGTKSDFNAALGDRNLGISKDKVTCSDGILDSPATSSFESEEGIAALLAEDGEEIIKITAESTAKALEVTSEPETTAEPETITVPETATESETTTATTASTD